MVIPERRFRSNNINTTNLQERKKSCNKLNTHVNNFDEATSLNTKNPINNLKLQRFKEDDLNKECVVYLVSGIKLRGYLYDFDEEIIILRPLDKTSGQVMVYQNTIATFQFKT